MSDKIETNKTSVSQVVEGIPTSKFNEIYLSSSPHRLARVSIQRLMLNVIIALLPLVAFSVYLYSWPALIRILVSVASTVGFESLFRLIIKRNVRIYDLSAVITGLLLALTMPPTIPIWILILSALFAIVVGKEFFGGLGKNPFNPALVGRAFAFVSFAGPMTHWVETRSSSLFGALSGHVDALSGATPLSKLVPTDGIVLSTGRIAHQLGISSVEDLYLALFFGNRSGSMGESPIFLIVLACLFLILTKTIDWRITVSMIVGAVLTSVCVGLLFFGAPIDPLLTLLSGSILFGAVFMATDYATSPVTPLGRIIFGAGCGILAVIIRIFSSNPEGVMFSILIMNAIAPYLDNLLPKKYGFVKESKK